MERKGEILLYKWIIGILIILLVGGSIYMFTNKNDYKEAPYAAGMNYDLEEVEPFLKHLSSSVLDSGFSQADIDTIQSEINTMKEDNEVKEIGTFDVIYKGKPTKIRIEAEIHIEDVSKEVVLYMYSIQELVDIIDEEMLKTEEEEE
jgi:hypothetical protein